MKIEVVKIASVKANASNPRVIKNEKFKKLVKSIKEFPDMLKLRPIVVDDKMIILGGNMRHRASVEAGLKEIPIIKASDLTEEQQQEFIIKDNASFGDWNWDVLANEWDNTKLNEWGIDVWVPEEAVDYSVLDDFMELDDEIDEMETNSERSTMIKFKEDDYHKALELLREFRDKGEYIGGILIERLEELR